MGATGTADHLTLLRLFSFISFSSFSFSFFIFFFLFTGILIPLLFTASTFLFSFYFSSSSPSPISSACSASASPSSTSSLTAAAAGGPTEAPPDRLEEEVELRARRSMNVENQMNVIEEAVANGRSSTGRNFDLWKKTEK